MLGQYEWLVPIATSVVSSVIGGKPEQPCVPPVAIPPGYIPEPPGPPNNWAPSGRGYLNPCTGHAVRVGRLGCELHDLAIWSPEDLRAAGVSCVQGLSLAGIPVLWLLVGAAVLGGVLLLLVML